MDDELCRKYEHQNIQRPSFKTQQIILSQSPKPNPKQKLSPFQNSNKFPNFTLKLKCGASFNVPSAMLAIRCPILLNCSELSQNLDLSENNFQILIN